MRDPTVKESLSSLFALPRAGVAEVAAAGCEAARPGKKAPVGRAAEVRAPRS